MTSNNPTLDLMAQVTARLRAQPTAFWVKLALDDGQTWYVSTGRDSAMARELPAGQTVGVIVRSDAYSLGALAAGKMTWADAMVAERVKLSGDVALIALLQQSLT